MNDLISRQAAIDAVKQHMNNVSGGNDEYYIAHRHIIELLQIVPTAEPESRREWYMHGYRDAQRWIPFETREPDAEEKQEHPEWDFVLCGKLPQDGQRILVNIKYKGHEAVQMDEYNDDGRECYLHSGYDIATEATAWMPLPEPWRGGQE